MIFRIRKIRLVIGLHGFIRALFSCLTVETVPAPLLARRSHVERATGIFIQSSYREYMRSNTNSAAVLSVFTLTIASLISMLNLAVGDHGKFAATSSFPAR